MNDPNSVLDQARQRGDVAGGRGVMATAARRCACVLAFVLLFLSIGVGGLPPHGTGAAGSLPLGRVLAEHGLALQIMGDRASAETLTDADQADKCGCDGGTLSTRARFKTH